MRLGLALPNEQAEHPFAARTLFEAARRIEAAGFESIWTFDAMGRGFLVPDPLTALAVAASATERVMLGTGVLQVPLRNPVELARRVLTTHLVCGDRLRLGVGSGSTPADFAAVGVDFDARFRALDRSLGVMRALWRGEKVGEADLGPIWPAVLGGPKVMIGAWAGSTWIKRAAQEFDGWVALGARSNWGLLAKGIARFRELGGRHAVVTNVPVRLGDAESSPDGPDDPAILRCSRSVAVERLRRFADLGFDDVVLVARRHDAEALTELRSLL
jgi:alkanesulfonate monooxygenase SsuD/methylene tetrahydromethanopterin reductase-like flavin-dependent oxidoreductase (luciferase family)